MLGPKPDGVPQVSFEDSTRQLVTALSSGRTMTELTALDEAERRVVRHHEYVRRLEAERNALLDAAKAALRKLEQLCAACKREYEPDPDSCVPATCGTRRVIERLEAGVAKAEGRALE